MRSDFLDPAVVVREIGVVCGARIRVIGGATMRFLFQFRRYRLPFRTVVRTAHGPWAEREGVIVRLETEAGGVGYGEAAALPWFGKETVDDVEAACRELGNALDEARLASVPMHLPSLRNALAAARAAMDAGPTAKPLGIAALLPAGKPALAEIARKAEAGFRFFKWKVGVGDLADELGWLDELCAALPNGGQLRLDANGAWDRCQASRWLERCADRPIEFVEQPIAADARGAADILSGLAGDYPTPVALDESLVTEGDLERWLGAGWPGVFVVKLSLLGDVSRAMQRLAAANADVVFSSALETGIGARAALRCAFTWQATAEVRLASNRSPLEGNSIKADAPLRQVDDRHQTPRVLGFGVWPLFTDARFDGPPLAPFIRWEDVERINGEAIWDALS